MMKTKSLWMGTVLVLCSRVARAGPDRRLAGYARDRAAAAPADRCISTRARAAAWKAALVSIDQSPDRGARMAALTRSTLEGASFKMACAAIRGSFDGTIAVTATRSPARGARSLALPLTLARATPETAWKDPLTTSRRAS